MSKTTVFMAADNLGQLGNISVSTTSVSTTSSNANPIFKLLTSYAVISILSCLFYKKRNSNLAKQIFYCLIFLFLCFHGSKSYKSKTEELRKCTNATFYNFEIIKAGNYISDAVLHINFCYLALNELKIKKENNLKFYMFLIILSGDISLNPGPSHNAPVTDNKFEPFNKRGLHLLHINVNSLL